ncbi:LppX_LprAFG lipoprotein [Tsukamurella sp. PLM1]|uniref:LppX_LprAFG lipoprotein n=1 Tax=Tsukamurella sp. PLM1 TaxID=2929795 RepID=UPI002070B28D|nr:LppX_LprAFG lipoprotein [Tsukamurella sp. PLM1]BDH55931.1 lipoarabinomannan carrier protein LprG [Tsukamurella sp. PLM1]
MKSSRPALIAASAAVALTVALTGCADKGSSSNGSGTTATANASASDAPALLKSAAEAAKNVTSVHFVMAVTGKVPNMPVSGVDGDLQIKPSTQATGTATIDIGGKSEGKFTYIDGKMYAALMGDKYVDYGDGASIYDVSALFDETRGIPNILAKVTGAKAEGSETIDGQETTKITGTVPATEIAAISGSRVAPEKSVPVPVTAWVQSSGDKQLVRLQVKPAEDGTITLTFSKWGEKVTVTKPSVEPAPTGAAPSDVQDSPR